jgi:hypothetical protein
MVWIRATLVAALSALLVAGALAQGLIWNQVVRGPATRMEVHSNGDLFVFSVPFSVGGFPVAQMRRFSPSGTLLSTSVMNGTFFDDPQSAFMAIRGDTIYCLVVLEDDSTLDNTTVSMRYDIPTATFTNWTTLDGGAYLNTSYAAFGDTHYMISGYRTTDGSTSFYQKRRLSDDGVALQSNYTGTAGQVVRRGNDTFIHVRTTPSPSPTLHLMRIGTLVSTHTTSVPNAGIFGCSVSADDNYVYVLNRSGVGTTYVRSFNLDTNSFGSPLTYTAPAGSGFYDPEPLGSSHCGFLLRTQAQSWFVRATPNALTVVELPAPTLGRGSVARDASGNLNVAITTQEGNQNSVRLFRMSRATAQLMSSARFDVPALGTGVLDQFLDTTGSLRLLYGTTYTQYYPEWNVAQVNPARLSIAGPFTIGGQNATGTVTLAEPAPAGGATFLLYSNNTAAVVPVSMTVPAGQTSANFTITTSAVAANAKPTINARYDGLNLQTNFDLAAPLIQSVSASPQVQYGGLTSMGTVTLTGPAPTGGKSVALSSSNTSRVTVPASVNVPAGQTSANFTITNIPTLANASSVISATTGAVTRTVFVAVNAPILLTASLAQTTLKGGLSTTIALTINAPAPSGYTVALVAGAASLVQLPSSFAIPQGATSVNVPVNTSAVTSTIAVTVVAYRGPYVRVMTLTLTP